MSVAQEGILEHVVSALSAETALTTLPAPVAGWFRRRFGEPTLAQRLAWPALADGKHLLLSAPTGTGKTLAAFVPLLGQHFTAVPSTSLSLFALYLAPLKALNNDAARNLDAYLDELAEWMPAARRPRIAVRTGDTTAVERRRLRDDPPDILLTTPESLAVLLSQPAMQTLFTTLRWVVVDEIHALATSKRGADLALSLERITALGDQGPQRVGLSATATPLNEAARFLVGAGRSCTIATAEEAISFHLSVRPLEERLGFVQEIARRIEPDLRAAASTLIFSNTRGLAERLAWMLRRQMPDWDNTIAVHHSSLAAERRHEIEQAFKRGHLRAVVSSTSLELGIDIGPVERVVLVRAPGDVVRLLQRLGRSGHGPGRLSHGIVLTSGPAQLLEAAVTAASGRAGQCEPLRIPSRPLDVLCQQLLGMACAGSCDAETVFALVRRAWPYRNLERSEFDGCLAYLFGLDRHGRPWLPARLGGEPSDFGIHDERTARLLRRNLGTIVDDEPVPVLLRSVAQVSNLCSEEPFEPEPQLLGEVDDAFADRLQPGDRFLLDGRCLEFRRRQGLAVLVEEAIGRTSPPRWTGDGLPLSAELAARLFLLRVQAAEALREGPESLAALLRDDYHLDGRAVEILAGYFQGQECVSEIPDPQTLLVEITATDGDDEFFLHTPLNRLGNDALARVAVHRLGRDHHRTASSVVADLGFALRVRGILTDDERLPDVLRALLTADGFDADLDAVLADSDALRSRFQRVAYTGLMLLRNPLGGRRRRVGGRDWGRRHLFDRVLAHDADFVLLRQAMREVREQQCDGPAARAWMERLPVLNVRCRRLAAPSPFVQSWTQPLATTTEPIETPALALHRLHAALMGNTP
jgi:ATP-dependent Lhr-like helicase